MNDPARKPRTVFLAGYAHGHSWWACGYGATPEAARLDLEQAVARLASESVERLRESLHQYGNLDLPEADATRFFNDCIERTRRDYRYLESAFIDHEEDV